MPRFSQCAVMRSWYSRENTLLCLVNKKPHPKNFDLMIFLFPTSMRQPLRQFRLMPSQQKNLQIHWFGTLNCPYPINGFLKIQNFLLPRPRQFLVCAASCSLSCRPNLSNMKVQNFARLKSLYQWLVILFPYFVCRVK
jgi:hypothetical protein